MKVKQVVVSKEADDDLEAGKAFYERGGEGVGEYFFDSLISDIESLLIYAGIHIKKHGYYRMFSKRFPYAIYYDLNDGIAQVVAILPVRRDPAWILKQLKGRG